MQQPELPKMPHRRQTGLVSHWEQGEKRPRVASLKLVTPVTKNVSAPSLDARAR